MKQQNITEYLDECAIQYYRGSPTLSDEEWDFLADKYDYQKVGASQHSNKATHFRRMYSLDKHYVGEGTKPLEGETVVSTLKLDGASLALLYVNGVLAQAVTRGDGLEGQDITSKILSSTLVPISINTTMSVLQITGEVVARNTIENARNYAAGALNLKDEEEFRTRDIQFYAYGCYPYITETFSDDMDTLEGYGLKTVYEPDLIEVYPSDGIVVRVNNNARFEELGYTAKFPKGAYAAKERAEAVETTLLAVEWKTGRTGKVSPVGILEPIVIDGATISRVTLNNVGFIEMMELYIGCTVGIVRAGSIIPRVMYRV